MGSSTRAVSCQPENWALMLPRILRPRGRADLRDSRGGGSSSSAGPACWRGRLRLLAAAAAPGRCCGWGGCWGGCCGCGCGWGGCCCWLRLGRLRLGRRRLGRCHGLRRPAAAGSTRNSRSPGYLFPVPSLGLRETYSRQFLPSTHQFWSRRLPGGPEEACPSTSPVPLSL